MALFSDVPFSPRSSFGPPSQLKNTSGILMLLGPMPSVRLITPMEKPQKQDVSAWLGSSSFCQAISTLIPPRSYPVMLTHVVDPLDAPQHPCHITLPLSTHGAFQELTQGRLFPRIQNILSL